MIRPVLLAGLVAALAFLSAPSLSRAQETYRYEHDPVLGTTLDLRVVANDEGTALEAEQAALDEIARLNSILSTYDSASEVSRWMEQAGQPIEISTELREVLELSHQWLERSSGAFDPRVAVWTKLWQEAQERGIEPSAEQLQAVRQQWSTAAVQSRWTWSSNRSLVAAGPWPLNFDAIAKGYVIDRVTDLLMKQPGVAGVSVNIGGDLRVAGSLELPVRIAEPQTERETQINWTLPLASRAMATSGPAYRGFEFGSRSYSHLIDPRTGSPVEHTVSVSVIADLAADADALATAMSVLSVDESVALAESLPNVECLIITRDGQAHASQGWPAEVNRQGSRTRFASASSQEEGEEVVWNGGHELAVKFEIIQAQGGRYRKPYVAVWVEDADGFPVKTLALWVQAGGPGPRWIPDLKRWYRSDRVRALVDPTDLVETLAEPSRRPAEYNLVWDGKDNQGELVKPGEYTVYIEAVREHGTYQLMRARMNLSDEAATVELEDNEEVAGASVEYRRKE